MAGSDHLPIRLLYTLPDDIGELPFYTEDKTHQEYAEEKIRADLARNGSDLEGVYRSIDEVINKNKFTAEAFRVDPKSGLVIFTPQYLSLIHI